MSPLARLRRIVQPGHGHRRKGAHTGAGCPEATVRLSALARPGDELLRPTEAFVQDIAYCPVEEAERLHVFLATGGRMCWTCRSVTVDPTPPGGES